MEALCSWLTENFVMEGCVEFTSNLFPCSKRHQNWIFRTVLNYMSYAKPRSETGLRHLICEFPFSSIIWRESPWPMDNTKFRGVSLTAWVKVILSQFPMQYLRYPRSRGSWFSAFCVPVVYVLLTSIWCSTILKLLRRMVLIYYDIYIKCMVHLHHRWYNTYRVKQVMIEK